MSHAATGWPGAGMDNRRLLLCGVVAMIIHAAVLTALVVGPEIFNSQEIFAPVYTVDLVGDIGLPPPPSAAEKAAEKSAPAKPKAETKPKPKPKVKAPPPAELIPVGKDKTLTEAQAEIIEKMGTPKESSKVKAVKAEEELDKALARIEEAVSAEPEETSQGETQAELEARHLDQALARTKERVETGAYGLGGSTKGTDRFAIYYSQVWQKVRSNWTLPSEWQQSEAEAIVVITVRADGEIIAAQFEKRSGNLHFDQSVMWAVERSNPLPPLPPGLAGPSHEIGIRFRPEVS